MVLVRALFQVFRWRMLSRFFIKLFLQVLEMANPILIFKFTEFVEKGEDGLSSDDYYTATLTACALLGLQLF